MRRTVLIREADGRSVADVAPLTALRGKIVDRFQLADGPIGDPCLRGVKGQPAWCIDGLPAEDNQRHEQQEEPAELPRWKISLIDTAGEFACRTARR